MYHYIFNRLKSNLPKLFGKFAQIPRLNNFVRCTGDDSSTDTALRHKYHEECEEYVNRQIHEELNAFYGYQAMAFYFVHPNVSLPGFYSMFLFFSKEETEHALKLMHFQNMRGGQVVLFDIKAPEICELTPISAVEKAIEMEKHVTNCLQVGHSIASKRNDLCLTDLIESEYLVEQYKGMKELQDLLTKLKRLGSGIGIHIIDERLKKQFENKKL